MSEDRWAWQWQVHGPLPLQAFALEIDVDIDIDCKALQDMVCSRSSCLWSKVHRSQHSKLPRPQIGIGSARWVVIVDIRLQSTLQVFIFELLMTNIPFFKIINCKYIINSINNIIITC
jgi:hypothetical protein